MLLPVIRSVINYQIINYLQRSGDGLGSVLLFVR